MLTILKSYMANIRNVLIVCLILFLCFLTWFFTKTYYQKVIAQSEVKQSQILSDAQSKQLETEHKAGEQHAKDQLSINRLASELDRMRVHVPSRKSTCSKDTNGTGGMAASRIEEYLDDAKRKIDSIGVRCSQLNLDAIQSNQIK